MQVLCCFSGQNMQTFDISHAVLPLTVAKLSNPKKSGFLSHPVYNATKSQLVWLNLTHLYEITVVEDFQTTISD